MQDRIAREEAKENAFPTESLLMDARRAEKIEESRRRPRMDANSRRLSGRSTPTEERTVSNK